MFVPQLYIEGTRADLWGDESIELTDSIKNLRNPDTFFDSYTTQFSLPATGVNNGIFKHYHNVDVDDGFNGAIRHDAEIRIGGLPFRKGQIKLNQVQISNGRPKSYDIVFYGNMSRIKDQLKDTKLNDLGYLSYLNHDYSFANVKNGFVSGLEENAGVFTAASPFSDADVVYPFISHTNQYILDDSVAGNIYRLDPDNPTDTTTQLTHTDFKPAIRLTEIFTGIEQECGVTFDTSGILGDTQFGNLWMWCHTAKGGVIGAERNTTTWYFSERTYSGSTVDVTYGNEFFQVQGLSGGAKYSFSLATTITGTGNYDVRVYDQTTGAVRYEERNATGNGTFTWEIFPNTGSNFFAPRIEIESDGTITVIDIQLTATLDLLTGTDPQGVYDYVSKTPNTFADIPLNMPKISCLDFIIGICRMFNLVIYADSAGTYYLEHIDDFYTGKTTRDITGFVDDTDRSVKPPTPFDDIILRFEEPNTFLIKERMDRVGETYGDETYSLGSIFEDNDYEVVVPFEKILFERMTDISDDSLEGWVWAWCVDQDQDPILTKPIIFYADGVRAGLLSLTWESDSSVSTQQVFCSNTVNDTTDWSLTFGSELGEYSQTLLGGDLFTEYWQNYITGVYDTKARTVYVKAWLPASFIIDYDLGDTIVYRNKEYFINEMTIDVRTGETQLELITKWL